MDFNKAKESHLNAVNSVFEQVEKIRGVIDIFIQALNSGGKVLWCGNGGSAADAQHMAAELMVRFIKDRKPLSSISLTTDTSLLTAHANDFEYETVFSRQVDGIGRAGDVLVLMTTSGSSKNILLAAEMAKLKGMCVVSLIGSKASVLSNASDVCFSVDAVETARIQEAHTLICHLICEGVDEYY